MKRNKFSVVILALVALLVTVPTPRVQAQNIGNLNVATQTLTIVSSYSTILGTVPANCEYVTVIASGADINYGPASVTNGTLWPYIKNGEIKEFHPTLTKNPRRYFIMRGTGTASAKLGIVAE